MSVLCMHLSTLVSNINNNWELWGRGEREKSLCLPPLKRQSHIRVKTRAWEITPKVEMCNRARCADNSNKEEVALVGSPHHGVQEKTSQSKANEPPKNPKQSKWAKHIIPCSPQGILTMVTASIGNSCWETDFSITTCSNCSGYCKTYWSILLVPGRRGRLMKVLSGQENLSMIWLLTFVMGGRGIF